MSPEDGRREREARSVALERAYVHDVYDQISTHFSNTRYRAAWPKVKQFVQDLEPGSLVADIGCGNGKYMQTNSKTFNIGIDRCVNLANSARHKGNELMISDNLCLPFRESSFDACISVAVIHHFGTTERRVSALRELARILRIGGKLMITVWAMEQRHRKFESQDVLVPWHRPDMSSSEDKGSSIDRDPSSTTTDEEDVMHYHACHQSDESASSATTSNRRSTRKRTHSRGGSNSAAEGSDAAEEDIDEDCYASCARHCELHPHHKDSDATSPKESCYSFVRRALQVASTTDTPKTEQKLTNSRRGSTGRSLAHGNSDWSPISDSGLRKKTRPRFTHGGSLDSQENLDDVPIELRHLEPDDPDLLHIPPTPGEKLLMPTLTDDSKSRILVDLVNAHSASPLPSKISLPLQTDAPPDIAEQDDVSWSKSSSLLVSSKANVPYAQQTSCAIAGNDKDNELTEEPVKLTRKRPILRKQKASIPETDSPVIIEISKPELSGTQKNYSENDIFEKDYLTLPKLGFIKQSSLNDELIYLDRVVENERIKQSIQKQSSLNEDLIYGNKNEESETLRERIFRSQYKHLQVIKEGFQRFRTASLDRFDFDVPESLRNNIVKLLHSWRNELLIAKLSKTNSSASAPSENDQSSEGFPETSISKLLSENRSRMQTFSINRRMSDSNESSFNGVDNKFSCRDALERKPSRDDGSDSSKESSLQSDTSLDSEDSCISVIFVPKSGQSGITNIDKERNRSVSSESSEGSDKPNSPKSPKSPKSPGGGSNGRYFATGKFLGTKMSRSNSSTSPTSSSSVECRRTSPPFSDLSKISPPSGELTLVTGSASFSLPTTSETIIEEEISSVNHSKCPEIKTESFSISIPSQCSVTSIVASTPTISAASSNVSKCEILNTGNNSCKKDSIKCVNDVIDKQSTLLKVPPREVVVTHSYSSPRIVTKPSHKNVRKKKYNKSLVPPPIPPYKPLNKLSSSISDHSPKHSFIKEIPKFDPKLVKRDITGQNAKIDKNTGKTSTKNVQTVRKSLPRFLTFEVFNPETDDLDSDSSASSSPHSGSSVIERGWPTEKEIDELDREIKRKEEEEKLKPVSDLSLDRIDESDEFPKMSLVEPVHRMDTISEESQNSESREQSPREKEFPRNSSLERLPSSTYEHHSGKFSSFSSIDPIPLPLSFKFPHYTSASPLNSVAFTNVSLPSLENRTSAKIKSLFSTSSLHRQPITTSLLDEGSCSSSSTIKSGSSVEPYQQKSSEVLLELSSSPNYSLASLETRNNVPHSLSKGKALPSKSISTTANVTTVLTKSESKPQSSGLEVSLTSRKLPAVPSQKLLPTQTTGLSYLPCIASPESITKTELKVQRKEFVEKLENSKFSKEIWTADTSLLSADSTLLEKGHNKKSYGTLKTLHSSTESPYNIPKAPPKPFYQTEVVKNAMNARICDVENNKSDLQKFTQSEIFRDSTQTILTDSTNDNVNLNPLQYKQSSNSKRSIGNFELPSFIQSFFSGPGATPRGWYQEDLPGPPTELDNKESKSNVFFDKNTRAPSLALEREKMNRSESCLPLLGCDDTASDLLSLDDVKSELLLLPEMRKRSDSSASVTSNSTSSTSTSKRAECKHCKREEENRKKKFFQDEPRKGDSRFLKAKRELLRPQGSLDSAQEKQSSGKSSWSELSRSGSLDLETATKLRGGSSRDGSLSTSQDSLQSDIGGAPTLHRYYHVFKEGELDQLIEKYVHNLHIIASYYDHANWCIVAEKVHVWTI